MTVKRWFAIDVTVEPDAAVLVEEALGSLTELGTAVDSLRKDDSAPAIITAFFTEPPDPDETRRSLAEALAIQGLSADSVHKVGLRDVEDADWLAEWKRHWQPTEIGRFIVSPPWLDADTLDKILIRIDPNMAFGTGTHETTQLCLEALGEFYGPSQTVLDVGTGTGVLAIAAAKLGATTIIACDTDHDSVNIARDNARLNGVEEQIYFSEGSIDENTISADIVCANLTLDVIEPMLPLLLTKGRCNLLLSGILAEQEPIITTALERSEISNLKFEIRSKGEWIAVIISFPAS